MNMIRVLFLVGINLLAISGYSCDGCGSAISGGGIGLVTQANARYLGFNYRYTKFHLTSAGSTHLTKDEFTDLQIMGRFALTRRLIVQANVPYRIISRKGEEVLSVDEQGLGDISALAQWTLMDQLSDAGRRFFWSAGVGASLPTGNYLGVYDDRTPDHLYPGTNAWGLLLQNNISLQFANWGINTQTTAQFRQPNQSDYRFGNQYTQSILAFWKKDFGKTKLAPFGGFYAEALQNGERYGLPEDPSTAGYGVFGQIGFEANFGKINLTTQVQLPVIQNYAQGEGKSQPRLSFSLAFLI